jgi:hypothetical protein
MDDETYKNQYKTAYQWQQGEREKVNGYAAKARKSMQDATTGISMTLKQLNEAVSVHSVRQHMHNLQRQVAELNLRASKFMGAEIRVNALHNPFLVDPGLPPDEPCANCDGDGYVGDEECPACEGMGTHEAVAELAGERPLPDNPYEPDHVVADEAPMPESPDEYISPMEQIAREIDKEVLSDLLKAVTHHEEIAYRTTHAPPREGSLSYEVTLEE